MPENVNKYNSKQKLTEYTPSLYKALDITIFDDARPTTSGVITKHIWNTSVTNA